MKNMKPFSIVFQILQECIFNCGFCNRRFEKGEQKLSQVQRKKMVDILFEKGAKRITITGGEPMMIKEDTLELLKYIHSNKIHTCLSTTGYNFDLEYFELLEKTLDHLLISIPTMDKNEWSYLFGSKKYSGRLFENVVTLLKWCKNSEIILEVSTVVQKSNISQILKIGDEIAKINSNIIWRIEYYYPMGINANLKNLFEVEKSEILKLHETINRAFEGTFSNLYLSLPTRDSAKDIFISPTGDLLQTNDCRYSAPLGNILDPNLQTQFEMRRDWKEYKKYCRFWK